MGKKETLKLEGSLLSTISEGSVHHGREAQRATLLLTDRKEREMPGLHWCSPPFSVWVSACVMAPLPFRGGLSPQFLLAGNTLMNHSQVPHSLLGDCKSSQVGNTGQPLEIIEKAAELSRAVRKDAPNVAHSLLQLRSPPVSSVESNQSIYFQSS